MSLKNKTKQKNQKFQYLYKTQTKAKKALYNESINSLQNHGEYFHVKCNAMEND